MDKLILDKLNYLGWEIIEGIKQITVNGFRFDVDLNIRIGNDLYFAELKESKNISNIQTTSFYRVVTRLNVISKETKMRPMVIYLVDQFEKTSMIRTLDKMFRKYAPDYSWLLIERSGGFAYRVSKDNEITYNGMVNKDNVNLSKRSSLGFSDLELWMLKVIFLGNYQHLTFGKRSDENIVRNAYGLSKLADVSSRTANKWVNNMKKEGYLRLSSNGALVFSRLAELLERWSGKYNIYENPRSVNLTFLSSNNRGKDSIVKKIKAMSNKGLYLLTGHYAAREYDLSISNADTLHFYYLGNDISVLENDLGLIETASETGITAIKSRFHQAVKRFTNVRENRGLVDLVQLFLDCRHLKDRGYEQALEIRDEIMRIYEGRKNNH